MAVGAGWQAVVAYVNIACYYLFGIPFGLLLGYKLDFGVKILKDRCCKIFDVLGNLVWDVDGNCGSDNSLDVNDLQDKLGQRGCDG
uniref:Uncharacterized protein n=1 Tax=Brassica oleracea var. oleracea TaxID=109376 RepID=A0A0D2ZWK1_BRAOL